MMMSGPGYSAKEEAGCDSPKATEWMLGRGLTQGCGLGARTARNTVVEMEIKGEEGRCVYAAVLAQKRCVEKGVGSPGWGRGGCGAGARP